MFRVTCSFCVVLAAGASCASPRADVEVINSPAMAELGLPFSEAVRVGDLLFLSGQIGLADDEFALVSGGLEAETHQMLRRIRDTLKLCGSDLDHVVKCTVFLADIDDWPAFNAIYRTYFTTSPPARSALAGSGLALGARVELECIAVVP